MKLGTRQIGLCRVSGTRQNKALGKAKLCPVPDTWQSWALGKEAPRDNGTQRRPLCQVPSVWHSAKYWLCRVPRASTRQNIHFAECQTLALGKINFVFVFCHQLFFLDLYLYHEQHVQIWHNFIAVCYISSLYFVFLQFSGKCRFELQVHRIIVLIHSKNVILVC